MEDIDGRGHSVLTPEGQIQSNRAFARGLGSRYGTDRVRTTVGRIALAGAVVLVGIGLVQALG